LTCWHLLRNKIVAELIGDIISDPGLPQLRILKTAPKNS
jgi:hypothetical protein